MANNEESVYNDPNFAVICSFVDKFGDLCGISNVTVLELQEKLEDTKNVYPDWVDLHVRLLRRAGKKSVSHERWEKALVKFCHGYSKVDAWEIERFGYKKSKLSVKVNLLKHLLEAQFDGYSKFKSEVNKLTAQELRILPAGRDINGQIYWYQIDRDLNFRIYREDQDDETWELIVSEKTELAKLIETLQTSSSQFKKEESTTTSENDDSKDCYAAKTFQKPKLDTGQEKDDLNLKIKNETPEDLKLLSADNIKPETLEGKGEKQIDSSNVKTELELNIKQEQMDEHVSNGQMKQGNIKPLVDNSDQTKCDVILNQESVTKSLDNSNSTPMLSEIPQRVSVIKMAEKVHETLQKEEAIDYHVARNDHSVKTEESRHSSETYPTVEDEKFPSKETSSVAFSLCPDKASDLTKKPTEQVNVYDKPEDSESKSVVEVKTEFHENVIGSCDSVVDLSKSRHDPKLVKELETISPPKFKQEDLKEKLKSDRMIPFKKREIPKDVDVCVSSEVDPLLRHSSRLLTVPEMGKETYDSSVANDIRNRLSPSHNVSVLPQCPSRITEIEMIKEDKDCEKTASHNIINLQTSSSSSEQSSINLSKDASNLEKSKSYIPSEISKNADLKKVDQNKEKVEEMNLLIPSAEKPLSLIHKAEENFSDKSYRDYRMPNVYESLKTSFGVDMSCVSQEKIENVKESKTEFKNETLYKEIEVSKLADNANREFKVFSSGEKNLQSANVQLFENKQESGNEALNMMKNLVARCDEESTSRSTKEHQMKSDESNEWKKHKMEVNKKPSSEKKVDNFIHRLLLGKSRDSNEFGPRKDKRRELGKLEMSVARLKEMKEIAKEREQKQDAKGVSKEKEQLVEKSASVKEKDPIPEVKNYEKEEARENSKEKESSLVVNEIVKEIERKQDLGKDNECKVGEIEVVKKAELRSEEESNKANKEMNKSEVAAEKSNIDDEPLDLKKENDSRSSKDKIETKLLDSTRRDMLNTSDKKVSQKTDDTKESLAKPGITLIQDESNSTPVAKGKNNFKNAENMSSTPDDKKIKVHAEQESTKDIEVNQIEKLSEPNKDLNEVSLEPTSKSTVSSVRNLADEEKSIRVDTNSSSTSIVSKNELAVHSGDVDVNVITDELQSSEKISDTTINEKTFNSQKEIYPEEKSKSSSNISAVKIDSEPEFHKKENKLISNKCSPTKTQEFCPSESEEGLELSVKNNENIEVKEQCKNDADADLVSVEKKNENLSKDISETGQNVSDVTVGKLEVITTNENKSSSKKALNDEKKESAADSSDKIGLSSEEVDKNVDEKSDVNKSKQEHRTKDLTVNNTDEGAVLSVDSSAKSNECSSPLDKDKQDKPPDLTVEQKPEQTTGEIIATQVIPQRPAGRGRRGRHRGRGAYRGRGKSQPVNEPADKTNPELGQSDSSQEKSEANEAQLKSQPGNRGGRYQRKRGRSKVVAFVDVSPPVKRSQRLQAQREKQEVEYRRIEEERRIIAEFEQKQKEEDRRRRQELKEQKIMEELELDDDEEDEDDDDDDEEDDKENKKKKKMKKKKRKQRRRRKGNNPWDYSSESSTSSSSSEHEENHEEEEDDEELVFNDKSDHEFSPESESECDPTQPTKVRRARTARKVKSDSDEDSEGGGTRAGEDDKPCSKCGNYDHPEWILLCDKCDAGFHTACLRPPLLIIPDGDWFCPPCEHNMLLVVLQDYLKMLEQALKKKEREEMRKKRLAYVGINLDNVLKPEKKELSENEEEDLHPKRSCRARKDISYQFKEYDDMIQSAIQEELIAERGAGMGKGKDMANITEAEEKEELAKKKRKHRRLNDLDSASDSDDDEDSDEDFKQSSGSNTHQTEDDDDDEDYNAEESDESWHAGRRRKNLPYRRSTRNRRRRGYDDDFVVDDDESEDSDGRRTMRRVTCKRISYREISDSDDQDEAWNKKQYQKRRRIESDEDSDESDWRETHKKSSRSSGSKSRIKRRWASDSDSEDSEEVVRTTRGKKMNYQELDLLDASDEEDIKKVRKKHMRIQDFEKDSDDDEQDKSNKNDDDDEDEDEDDDDEDDEEESDEEESEERMKEKKSKYSTKYNIADNAKTTTANSQCLSVDVDDKNSDSGIVQRSVIMSVKSNPSADKGVDESQDIDLPENVSERKAMAMKNESSLFKENGLQPDHQRLPIDYRENASPMSQSLMQPGLPQPCPSKLMMLDSCSSRSSPQGRLTMLDTYSNRSTPPALHTFDSKLERSHAMASPGRQSSPHPSPHSGMPPPPYVGDYSTYVGPYYPPSNFGQQNSPHSRYSPQGYNGPPPPPQPPPSQPLHGQTHPFAPPYQHSPHYTYGPEGYPEGDQYEGHPQPYAGYPNYSSPIEQESQASQPQTGNYAVNSLLQRRTDGTGEEDEFNGVNDLVSYITGSHENQL